MREKHSQEHHKFNILDYAKDLKAAGFTEAQVEVQSKGMLDLIEDNLATKQDILQLESKILELQKNVLNIEANLKRDIAHIDTNLKRDIKESEFRLKIWLGSMMAAGIVLLGAFQSFLIHTLK